MPKKPARLQQMPRKPVAVEFPIADIIIGNRQRRDLGDIEALAASIEDIGLPHPVVLTPQRELISGEWNCSRGSTARAGTGTVTNTGLKIDRTSLKIPLRGDQTGKLDKKNTATTASATLARTDFSPRDAP